MKVAYQTIRHPLRRLLKKPGSWRIAFGIAAILPLVLFSFLSDHYKHWIDARRLSARNTASLTDFVSEPPSIGLFQRLLAPRHASASEPAGEAEEPFALDPTEAKIQPFHYLGTDQYGRDLLATIMEGARIALWGSLLAILISLVIGVPLGVISGYYGGVAQKIIDYLAANITTLPRLIMLIIIVATLGYDFMVIMITIGLLSSTKIMDIVQQKIRILKEAQFIEAAKELGLPDYKIIFKHILWRNCNTLIFIQLTYEIAEVILLESTLSYLGWGVKDQVSWGGMVAGGMDYLASQHYWMLFFPSLAIVLSIAGFMMLAEGLSKWFASAAAEQAG